MGLHGRISNLPAENIATERRWMGDQLVFSVKGRVREAKTLSCNMALYREITSFLGENKIIIKDKVVNEGFKKTPHMFLYHFNVGHPILDSNAKLFTSSKKIAPRDEVAASRQENIKEYLAPTRNYPDTVYYHQLEADEDNYCKVSLINRRLCMGIYLKYKQENLPNFIQWKYTGEGDYVAGLEPANCLVEGRARGSLVELEPAEEKEYLVEIGLLTNKDELNEWMSL